MLWAELGAKRLELLRELVPAATRIAVLNDPTGSSAESALRNVEAAARAMGLQIQVHNVNSSREIAAAFASFMRERADALFVSAGPFVTSAACNWLSWQRATRSLRHMRCVNMPKSAGC